jgi:hypothetical protein
VKQGEGVIVDERMMRRQTLINFKDTVWSCFYLQYLYTNHVNDLVSIHSVKCIEQCNAPNIAEYMPSFSYNVAMNLPLLIRVSLSQSKYRGWRNT